MANPPTASSAKIYEAAKNYENSVALEDAIKTLVSEIHDRMRKSKGKFFGTVVLTLPYRDGQMSQFHLEVNRIFKPADVDTGKQVDRI